MAHSPPRVIICDLGNVLVDIIPPGQKSRFWDNCGVSAENLITFFRTDEEFFAYERGHRSTRRFYEVVREKLKYRGDYQQFLVDFCDLFSLNRGIYELLFADVKVSNNVEFWLLSNINEFHWRYVADRWPGIVHNCSRMFLSFELQMRKGDPGLWERILREGGAEAGECLLLDDMEGNCADAARAGIGSVVVADLEMLRRELRASGLKLG